MFMQRIQKATERFLGKAAAWRRNLLSAKSLKTFIADHHRIITLNVRKLRQIRPFLFPCALPLHSSRIASRSFNEQQQHDAEIEENITHLIVLAKFALEKGDKERAEAILDMGLKLCDERNITFGLPFMYDILATIALSNGDIAKAEQLLVTVIERMCKTGSDENDHHIVDFKLRLARIYSALLEYDMAEIGFKSCMEAQKRKIAEGDISTQTGMLYINVLFWYGIHKFRNHYFSNAKSLLDTAYGYAEIIKGLSPYQEMVILYTLADLNMELGEYDIALLKMQNAVMLGKGIGSMDLPRCYLKLARIYYNMNVHDQAKAAADEGIKLAKIFNYYDVIADGHELLKLIEQDTSATSMSCNEQLFNTI